MFHELITDEEKIGVLELLKSRKREQWLSNNVKDYWHTSRMVQSLQCRIIEKRIFVQNPQDIKVILSHFGIKRRTNNCEVWIEEDLSIDELNSISKSLLEIAHENLSQGKMTLFMLLPSNLANIMKKELCGPDMHLVFERSVYNYYCHASHDAIPILDGFEAKSIPEENTEKVTGNWAYGTEEDQVWVRQSIRDQPSMGIWDLASGDLVGQFICMPTGTFGALSIDPKYRGIGLAKIVIGRLVEYVRQKDMEMLIVIEKDNIASMTLFEKLHFERTTESVFMVFTKSGEFPVPGVDF